MDNIKTSKPELHSKTREFVKKHNLDDKAGYALEAFVEPAYGEILIAMLIGLMKDKEAIEEFEKFIADESLTNEGKTIAMVEELNTLLNGEMTTADIFDGFLDEIIFTIEKNVNKFIKLYNKSREGASSKEEVDENFEGYIDSLIELNTNKLKKEIENV